MGNTLMSAHRLPLGFIGGWLAAHVHRWSHCARISLMQMANQQWSKVDDLDSSPEWPESDALADEGFANKSAAAAPFDFAIATHLSLLPSVWIVQNAAG